MALPILFAKPDTEDQWRSWSFNHAANHYDIVNQVATVKKQLLEQFCLDPMDRDNLGMWLYQHQVMHNQANSALGTSGLDLLDLDWQDPEQFAQWLLLNGSEHQRLSAALGIG